MGFLIIPVSDNEYKLLQENPFAPKTRSPEKEDPFAPETRSTGIDDLSDALIPNIKKTSTNEPQFISRCSSERYDEELNMALEEARSDRDKKTVVIQYAVSVGAPKDDIAHCAHMRSLLRVNSESETKIYGGTNVYPYQNKDLYFLLDNTKARDQFINGERCFFSTMKIKNTITKSKYERTTCDVVNIFSYSGYLLMLNNIDYTKSDKPIIPVYLADFRNDSINMANILNDDFVKNSIRGKEISVSLKNVFNFLNVWSFREELTDVLSTNREVGSYQKYAYEAMPQLIDWIIFSGLSARVTPTQYTPLVLDLGEKHIKTSSLEWGTFFDLSRLGEKLLGEDKVIHHLTAWVGGNLVSGKPNDVTSYVFKREADDGFLVIPSSGKVMSGKNLFGTLTDIEGDNKFSNGFEALAKFAMKDCNSSDIKKRYVGPWDGEIYSKVLKVWIDKNRNGISEPEEIKGLAELGIAAINSCYYLHEKVEDRFGNLTKHRAVFLLLDPNDSSLSDTESIVSILKTGNKVDGRGADFRAVIDIFFKTNTEVYLENLPTNLQSQNQSEKLPLQVHQL